MRIVVWESEATGSFRRIVRDSEVGKVWPQEGQTGDSVE